MKKGVFNAWFKEIVTLIFTQTVQAFLLAIVLTIIISALKNNSSSVGDGAGAAAGLLAIIALSQFSKLELLVKNIFGVTSGFGDPSLANGRNTLTAGKAMVLGNLRRLGDNGRKVAQVGKGISAGLKMRDLKDEKAKLLSQDSPTLNGSKPRTNGGGNGDDENNNEKLNADLGSLLQAINVQTEKIEAQTQAMERNRLDDKLKELDQKIADTKKERNDAYKTAAGGIVETAGALYGGVAGTMYGLAQGDQIVTSALGGMEAGDAAAQTAFNTAVSAGTTAGRAIKTGGNVAINAGKGAINAHNNGAGLKGTIKGAAQNATKHGRSMQDVAKNIQQYQNELNAMEQKASEQQKKELQAQADKYYEQISEVFNNQAIRNVKAGKGVNPVKNPIKRVKTGKINRVKELPKNYDIGKN